MPTIEWPHTMAKGEFKGRRFESNADYLEALKSRSLVSTNGDVTHKVRRIVDAYELLRAEGLGKDRAIRLIAALDRP